MPVTRPRRAWARFALRLVIALVVTGVGTAAAVVTARDYAVSKFDDTVGTVPIQAGVLTPRGAGSQPAQNLLIVGSDSRAGLEGEGFGDPNEVGGQRSDVIMLVHVDPKDGTATLVSIPRDTWVTLDNGRKGRINESFARGADGVIKTVTANFGIPVNHYLEVDFAGVRDIVNSVGGVTVFLYYPARDRLSGLDVGGGCQHLDGDQGLAYVRARHFESFVDGKWVTDPTGDIGRINRQQDFVRRLAATALADVGSNPLKANSIGNSILAALKRDPGFSAQDAFDIAGALQDINTGAVPMTQIPTRLGNVNGASVLFWDAEAVAPVLAPFLDVPAPPSAGEPGGPPATAAPADVSVRVLNGAGVVGLAGRTRDTLSAKGFKVVGVADADRLDHEVTEIRFVDQGGGRAKAEAVKAALGAGQLTPVLAVQGADVELVLGRDYDRPGGALGSTDADATPATQLISHVVPAQATDPEGPGAPPSSTGAAEVPPVPC
jgi:LCP family protein required for cell wall assembly